MQKNTSQMRSADRRQTPPLLQVKVLYERNKQMTFHVHLLHSSQSLIQLY